MHGALGTRSSAIFDYDADGDLDIITAEFGDVPQVLRSDLSSTTKIDHLSLRLRGTVSNRSGIGARVVLHTADGLSQTRYVDGKSGYLGFSDAPLYFALQSDLKRIEVEWPNGLNESFDFSRYQSAVTLVEGHGREI